MSFESCSDKKSYSNIFQFIWILDESGYNKLAAFASLNSVSFIQSLIQSFSETQLHHARFFIMLNSLDRNDEIAINISDLLSGNEKTFELPPGLKDAIRTIRNYDCRFLRQSLQQPALPPPPQPEPQQAAAELNERFFV